MNFPKIFECHDGQLPIYDPNGEDGKYSFLCLENGYKIPTREWVLVKRAQEGKMSVNLQIKMWAETMWSNNLGCLLFPDELRTYCEGMPPWVFKATMEQAQKNHFKEHGFIPTFLTFKNSH